MAIGTIDDPLMAHRYPQLGDCLTTVTPMYEVPLVEQLLSTVDG